MCTVFFDNGAIMLMSAMMHMTSVNRLRSTVFLVHATVHSACACLLTLGYLVSVLLHSPSPIFPFLAAASSTSVMIKIHRGGTAHWEGGGVGLGVDGSSSAAGTAAQERARDGIRSASIICVASAAVILFTRPVHGSSLILFPSIPTTLLPILPAPVIPIVTVITRAATAGRDCLRGDCKRRACRLRGVARARGQRRSCCRRRGH